MRRAASFEHEGKRADRGSLVAGTVDSIRQRGYGTPVHRLEGGEMEGESQIDVVRANVVVVIVRGEVNGVTPSSPCLLLPSSKLLLSKSFHHRCPSSDTSVFDKPPHAGRVGLDDSTNEASSGGCWDLY